MDPIGASPHLKGWRRRSLGDVVIVSYGPLRVVDVLEQRVLTRGDPVVFGAINGCRNEFRERLAHGRDFVFAFPGQRSIFPSSSDIPSLLAREGATDNGEHHPEIISGLHLVERSQRHIDGPTSLCRILHPFDLSLIHSRLVAHTSLGGDVKAEVVSLLALHQFGKTVVEGAVFQFGHRWIVLVMLLSGGVFLQSGRKYVRLFPVVGRVVNRFVNM